MMLLLEMKKMGILRTGIFAAISVMDEMPSEHGAHLPTLTTDVEGDHSMKVWIVHQS